MRIGTHDGIFHADDIFAVATIATTFGLSIESDVVRTRDPSALEKCTFVVDVGGEYDPERGRFDHHQKGRAGQRPSGVYYSAAGLVWKKFGVSYVRTVLSCSSEEASSVAEALDRTIISAIDALDNGQGLCSAAYASFPETPSFELGVSDMISRFNLNFFEEQSELDAFSDAVCFAWWILRRSAASELANIRAATEVREAVRQASGGAIVELSRYVPWKPTVCDAAPRALFVVYPSVTGTTWMVEGVPVHPDSFVSRQRLPEAWGGLRGDDIVRASGVSDAVFCHPALFCCGARSREGALEMARKALDT